MEKNEASQAGKPPKQPPPWAQNIKHIIAGGLSGVTTVLITYPTDFIKTQLQLDKMGKVRQYKGPGDCFKQTISKHGFFRLYSGMPIVLYGSAPKVALRFVVFEFLRDRLQDETGRLTNTGKILAGLGAGVAEAVAVVTPMDTIKVKLINDTLRPKPQYKSFIHGVASIIKEGGFLGLYRASFPTLLRQATNQAVSFLVMETLKDLYKGNDRDKVIPKPIVGLMGACSGAASVLSNNPIDVVKTRMQSLEGSQYKSGLDCFIKVWKTQGIKGLYVGLMPRLCRIGLDVAVIFMIYDIYSELLNKYW